MAKLTYREMWETYVEPTLKAQAEVKKQAGAPPGPSGPALPADDGPMTLERKIAECQAAGFMFGADPLEVAKAVKAGWPVKPADVDRIRRRLAQRAKEATP